jgi:hypothetical protein
MTIKIPVEADLGNISQAVDQARIVGEKAMEALIKKQREYREEVERTIRVIKEMGASLDRIPGAPGTPAAPAAPSAPAGGWQPEPSSRWPGWSTSGAFTGITFGGGWGPAPGGAFDRRIVEQTKAVGEKTTDILVQQQRKQRQEIELTQRAVESLGRALGRTITPDQARAAEGALWGSVSRGGFGSGFFDANSPILEQLFSPDFAKKFATQKQAQAVQDEMLKRVSSAIGIQSASSGRWTRMAGAATGAVTGAILGGGDGGFGGMLGGAAGGFLGTALAFGNPIGGIIGSTVGAGLGGAIDRHLDRALTEALETSNLRKNLGGLSAEFDDLREVSRAASSGLGMASTEFLQAERAFARTAGTLPGEVQGLASETRGAAQFARSLGLSPEAGITFFAQERQFRGTNDEAGARRLGFSIAEAMNRSGLFSKADEVLQAVAGFTATAARSGLATPNVGGYTDILAALAGQGGPYARDVQGAAGLIGRLDASFRGAAQGGSEGWRNFLLGSYQRSYGPELNGLDLSNLQEGGLFGTLEGAIGEGSVAWKAADPDTKRHYAAVLAQAKARGTANIPFIDIQMAQLKQETGGNVQWMAAAAQRNMGIGSREFYALWETYNKPGGITGLYNKLKGYQVDPDTLPMGNIIALSQFATGGRDTLMQQANRLLSGDEYANKLTGEEAERLQKAMGGGNVEELRQAVVQLSASREMKDLGEKSLEAQKGIENELTKLSSKMLPVLTEMKDAVLAGLFKTRSGFDEARKAFNGETALNGNILNQGDVAQAKVRMAKRMERIREIKDLDKNTARRADGSSPYQEELEQLYRDNERDGMILGQSAMGKSLSPEEKAALSKVSAEQGLPESAYLRLMALEASGPRAVSPKGAKGRMQVMPSNFLKGEDPFDPEDNFRAGGRVYQYFLKHYGGNEEAATAAYNGGFPAGNAVMRGRAPPAEETRKYLNRNRAMETPLPAGHRAEGGRFGMDDVNINVHHHHVDSSGVPVAPPVVETHVGRPRLLNAVPGQPALSEMF